QTTIDPESAARAGFVAINYIACKPDYKERFECLFCSRARMIDNMPGFLGMKVLRCTEANEPYLVVSFWTEEDAFKAWV
ncbi:antibiotic biosynthesis monooxygenase family protein, partial [Klebsiella pneumoniae]|uniref:antibiotic biosynthesis monooxygenase family protein n=1 Tax=Klebsiella pneumoniae TaxID=573 RepID=UPI003853659C